MRIKNYLTISKFEKWLKSKKATAYVGTTRKSNHCPLAKFLQNATQLPLGILTPECIDEADSNDICSTSLPKWAQTFINTVDSLPGCRVTAKKALSILQDKNQQIPRIDA